jgi:hypothetical protein
MVEIRRTYNKKAAAVTVEKKISKKFKLERYQKRLLYYYYYANQKLSEVAQKKREKKNHHQIHPSYHTQYNSQV